MYTIHEKQLEILGNQVKQNIPQFNKKEKDLKKIILEIKRMKLLVKYTVNSIIFKLLFSLRIFTLYLYKKTCMQSCININIYNRNEQ